MPRGNKTGPSGQGTMTGRKLGYCTGNDQPGYMSDQPGMGLGQHRGFGRGFGFRRGGGFGIGRGRGWGYDPTPPAPAESINELELLKNQSQTLKADLEAIEKRIRDIEKK